MKHIKPKKWVFAGVSFLGVVALLSINFYIIETIFHPFQNHSTVSAKDIEINEQAMSTLKTAEQAPLPVKQPGSLMAALTFDDGPDAKYTPQILDVLKQHEAKATFFVVGKQAANHPDIMQRISKEGHAIGNHSWDHADLSKLPAAQMKKEIDKTDEIIQRITGIPSTLFRPPYGAVSEALKHTLAAENHPIIEWTVDTKDWAGTPPEEIVNTVKQKTKPGAIILMHSFGGKDGNLSNTVQALPIIIDYLQSNGYNLVTVPDLKKK